MTPPTEPGDGPGRVGDNEGKSELPGSQLCQRGVGEGEIDPPGGGEAGKTAVSAEESGLGEVMVPVGIQGEVSGHWGVHSPAPWPRSLWGLSWSLGAGEQDSSPCLARWPRGKAF